MKDPEQKLEDVFELSIRAGRNITIDEVSKVLEEKIEDLELLWLSRTPDSSTGFNKAGINKSQVLNIIKNLR